MTAAAFEPAAHREDCLDLVSSHSPKPSQVLQGGHFYCIVLSMNRRGKVYSTKKSGLAKFDKIAESVMSWW